MTKPMYIWDGLSWQPAVDNLLGTTAKVVYQASEPDIVEVGTVWVNSAASAVPDYTATSATQIAYSPSIYTSASATNVKIKSLCLCYICNKTRISKCWNGYI